MEVKQLQAKQSNVDIMLDVMEIGEEREFQKFGKPGRVATAMARDKKGDTINLTLWNEDIDRIKTGDEVHLTNGYVSEWQGELQLTTGKYGRLEVVGKAKAEENVYRNYPPEADKDILSEEEKEFTDETVDEF